MRKLSQKTLLRYDRALKRREFVQHELRKKQRRTGKGNWSKLRELLFAHIRKIKQEREEEDFAEEGAAAETLTSMTAESSMAVSVQRQRSDKDIASLRRTVGMGSNRSRALSFARLIDSGGAQRRKQRIAALFGQYFKQTSASRNQ